MSVAEATSQPAEPTAAASMVEQNFRLSNGSSISIPYWNAGYLCGVGHLMAIEENRPLRKTGFRMSASQKKIGSGRLRMPLCHGILPLDQSRIWADLAAGLTLAAVGIPEVMGYTKIIETPVITGLYTMFLPILAFAIFGSSRHLVVAADSATAVMVATALTSLAAPYSPRYVALTALVALMAGAMLLLARLLLLGVLADFLSRTLLVGFLTGVGVQVALGERQG